MFSNTVDVHGLSPEDAVDIVRRKLERARAANADSLRILHGGKSKKLLKLLEAFLDAQTGILSVEVDEGEPSVIAVAFQPRVAH
jgi:dsDNA-specific endonuclease/ATPase MutS2